MTTPPKPYLSDFPFGVPINPGGMDRRGNQANPLNYNNMILSKDILMRGRGKYPSPVFFRRPAFIKRFWGKIFKGPGSIKRKFMVIKIFVLFLLLLLSPPAFCGEATLLKTPQEKLSYGLGVDMARNIQRLDIEVDMEFLVKGLNDVLSGGKLRLSEEELRTTVNTFQTEIRQKQVQAARIAGPGQQKGGRRLPDGK